MGVNGLARLLSRSIATSLFVIALVFLLFTTILPGFAGCGKGQDVATDESESAGSDKQENSELEGEANAASYIEGQITLILDTDLLWAEGKGDITPQGEQVQAATKKVYDLAARHGCTVEEYEFLGPYEGAIVVMGLPAGKDEDEAIAEFLEEPLVAHAYRTEASE
jgi:hypothetical protein